MAPLSEVALHPPTVMTTDVVTEDMDFAVTQQATAQVIEMAHEQSRTAALFGPALGHYQGPRAPGTTLSGNHPQPSRNHVYKPNRFRFGSGCQP